MNATGKLDFALQTAGLALIAAQCTMLLEEFCAIHLCEHLRRVQGLKQHSGMKGRQAGCLAKIAFSTRNTESGTANMFAIHNMPPFNNVFFMQQW